MGSHFWGFQTHGVLPDIVTMAKGIANGFPMAAVVTTPGRTSGQLLRQPWEKTRVLDAGGWRQRREPRLHVRPEDRLGLSSVAWEMHV